MAVRRMDHVSINVGNLDAAKSFFLDLGLELHGVWEMEGEWLDRLLGLEDVKTECVALRTPDGQTWIELVQFHNPRDEEGHQNPPANALGIRHIAFEVEDIDAMVARLREKGIEIFSDVYRYEDSYKLCYVRGTEGIILELAERIQSPR